MRLATLREKAAARADSKRQGEAYIAILAAEERAAQTRESSDAALRSIESLPSSVHAN
jgi:hypothetical protein